MPATPLTLDDALAAINSLGHDAADFTGLLQALDTLAQAVKATGLTGPQFTTFLQGAVLLAERDGIMAQIAAAQAAQQAQAAQTATAVAALQAQYNAIQSQLVARSTS